MKHQQFIAWLLLIVAFLVLLGILLNINIYWSIVDIAVILICSGSGFYLLRKKKQVE